MGPETFRREWPHDLATLADFHYQKWASKNVYTFVWVQQCEFNFNQ